MSQLDSHHSPHDGDVPQQPAARRRRLWYSFGQTNFSVVGRFEFVSDVAVAIHEQLGQRLSPSPLTMELRFGGPDGRLLRPEDPADSIPDSCSVAPQTCRSTNDCLHITLPNITGTATNTRRMNRPAVQPRPDADKNRSTPINGERSSSATRTDVGSRNGLPDDRGHAVRASFGEQSKRFEHDIAAVQQVLTVTASGSGGVTLPSAELEAALRPLEKAVRSLVSSHKGLVDALEALIAAPKARASSQGRQTSPTPSTSAPGAGSKSAYSSSAL